MRKLDKLNSINKANLLAEQRYIAKLNESTDVDLINIITSKVNSFSMEDSNFDSDEFTISLFNDGIEGVIINGTAINNINVDITGKYEVTSHGYYSPGKYSGPPEDSYPDESEGAEFDTQITSIKIGTMEDSGDITPIMELQGPDIQKLPQEFIRTIDIKVSDMLLDSGKFDPSNKNDYYDGPDDYDDY
jgi:hypothetical protein